MVEKIWAYLQKPKTEQENAVPEGVCPNCWGRQEYEPYIRELYAEKQIDVNNKQANYAFIQNFVVDRIEGIQLKKGLNGYECPSCKIANDGR